MSVDCKVRDSNRRNEKIGILECKSDKDALFLVKKLNGLEIEEKVIVTEYVEKYSKKKGGLNCQEPLAFIKSVGLNTANTLYFFRIDGLPGHTTKSDLDGFCFFSNPVTLALFRSEDDSLTGVVAVKSSDEAENCVKRLNGAVIKDEVTGRTNSLSAVLINQDEIKFNEFEESLRVKSIDGVVTGLSAYCKQLYSGVCVKNVAAGVTEKDLYDLFAPCGSKITSIFINKEHYLSFKSDNSYAFIHFAKPESAVKAANECHMWLLRGRRILVSQLNDSHTSSTEIRSSKPPGSRLLYDWYYEDEFYETRKYKAPKGIREYSLCIGNLPVSIKKDAVKDMCRRYGVIRDVGLGRGPDISIKGSNWSTVKYRDLASVFQAAGELNGKRLNGHTLKVEADKSCRLLLKELGKDAETIICERMKERKAEEERDTISGEEHSLLWQLCQQWICYSHYFGCPTVECLIDKLVKAPSKVFLSDPVWPEPLQASENTADLLENARAETN